MRIKRLDCRNADLKNHMAPDLSINFKVIVAIKGMQEMGYMPIGRTKKKQMYSGRGAGADLIEIYL